MMLAPFPRGCAAAALLALLAPAGLAAQVAAPGAAAASAPATPAPTTAPAPAAAPAPADVPRPRTDANSAQAHRDLLAKRDRGRIDLYFIGDSITRRWGAAEPTYAALLAHWRRSFHGWNAANFAWGGDTTANILWRLDQGELDGVHPQVIVVMAGTNNLDAALARQDATAHATDVVRGLAAILERCWRLAPGARIVLMGIPPRNDDMAFIPVIRQVNAQLARLADGQRTRFIDLGARLADDEGRLLPGMADADGLHLALPAYEVWAEALRPVLTAWLGPPAAEDHAPPPTGNPAAMR